MTRHPAILVASAQLTLFVVWFLGELWGSTNTIQLAVVAGHILVVLQCIFCWVAIHFLETGSVRNALGTGAAMLMVPLPVYALLFVMGGFSLAGLQAIQLTLAGLIACCVATSHGLPRLLAFPPPYARMFVLLQFLPAFWMWSQRDVWLSWLPLT